MVGIPAFFPGFFPPDGLNLYQLQSKPYISAKFRLSGGKSGEKITVIPAPTIQAEFWRSQWCVAAAPLYYEPFFGVIQNFQEYS
jgi:hypothetical protein